MTDDSDILTELRSIRLLLEQIRDQSAPRPRLLGAEQAAELLGVPATTVKRVARQTGIHVKLERNRMGFTSEILDELAEAIAKPQPRRRRPSGEPGEIDYFTL